MSSIHNTQRCLLKAPGVTYERLLPICLTLFSCSSCHSVCMSAAAADRSLSFPPLQPTPSSPHPTIISGSLRNGLAMWGCSGTEKAATLWPLELTFLTWTSYFLPLQQKTKTNLIMRLHSSKKKNKALISMWCFDNHLSTWPVISPTGSAWHLQQRGDGAQVVHLSPRLPLSPLLSISVLTPPCVHNLISKQGVDSHYGNPGKWPGHFPPYLGSPSGEGTLALAAPLVQSLCVFWWAYAAEMAFTLHWLQWDWPTRLTLFESTTHFNNVTKQNRVVMLNKTFLSAQGARWGS